MAGGEGRATTLRGLGVAERDDHEHYAIRWRSSGSFPRATTAALAASAESRNSHDGSVRAADSAVARDASALTGSSSQGHERYEVPARDLLSVGGFGRVAATGFSHGEGDSSRFGGAVSGESFAGAEGRDALAAEVRQLRVGVLAQVSALSDRICALESSLQASGEPGPSPPRPKSPLPGSGARGSKELLEQRVQLVEDLLRARDQQRDAAADTHESSLRALHKRLSSVEALLATNQEAVLALERALSARAQCDEERYFVLQQRIEHRLADFAQALHACELRSSALGERVTNSQQDLQRALRDVQESFDASAQLSVQLQRLRSSQDAAAAELSQLKAVVQEEPSLLEQLRQEQLRVATAIKEVQSRMAVVGDSRLVSAAHERQVQAINILDSELRELKSRFLTLLRVLNEQRSASALNAAMCAASNSLSPAGPVDEVGSFPARHLQQQHQSQQRRRGASLAAGAAGTAAVACDTHGRNSFAGDSAPSPHPAIGTRPRELILPPTSGLVGADAPKASDVGAVSASGLYLRAPSVPPSPTTVHPAEMDRLLSSLSKSAPQHASVEQR